MDTEVLHTTGGVCHGMACKLHWLPRAKPEELRVVKEENILFGMTRYGGDNNVSAMSLLVTYIIALEQVQIKRTH